MELKFRKLKASEIDIRVGRVINTDKFQGVSLLLYKDARVDQDILDETVGAMNWQRQHSRDNANCQVGIYDTDKNQWVWKEDTGTESNTEAEKGLASDSFKRACVNWGIGRELYSAKNIVVACELSDKKPKNGIDWFVKEIDYDGNNIVKLVIAQTIYGKEDKIVYSQGNGAPKVEKKTVEPNKDKVEEQGEKFLTYAQALELSFKNKAGNDVKLKALDVIELSRLSKTDNPEWEELRKGAKLILEFKANAEGQDTRD